MRSQVSVTIAVLTATIGVAQEKPMQDLPAPTSDVFFDGSFEQPIDLAGRTPLRNAATPTLPQAAPMIGPSEVERRYVNSLLNSRLTTSLPDGAWRESWRVDLDAHLMADTLLFGNDRILAQSNSLWSLLDAKDGKQLQSGACTSPCVVLDAERGAFYHVDRNGNIAVRHTNNGATSMLIAVYMGDGLARSYLARFDSTLLSVGAEVQMDAHGNHQPNLVAVEAIGWPAKPRIDSGNYLTPSAESPPLLRRCSTMSVIASRTRVVLLLPGAVYWAQLISIEDEDEDKRPLADADEPTEAPGASPAAATGPAAAESTSRRRPTAVRDEDDEPVDEDEDDLAGDEDDTPAVRLQIVVGYDGIGVPVAASLDEEDRLHLLHDHEGKRRLSIITPAGEEQLSITLPTPLDQIVQPPIIGYDHRIYLLTARHVAALEIDGAIAWLRPALRRFGGAVVTADDKLLASDGPDIVYFGRRGERVAVHNFKDAPQSRDRPDSHA